MRTRPLTPYFINSLEGKDSPVITLNAPRGGSIRVDAVVAPAVTPIALQAEGDFFSMIVGNTGAALNTATITVYQTTPNVYDPVFGGWLRAQIGAAIVIVGGAGGPQSYGPVAVTGTGIMFDIQMALALAPIYIAYRWS